MEYWVGKREREKKRVIFFVYYVIYVKLQGLLQKRDNIKHFRKFQFSLYKENYMGAFNMEYIVQSMLHKICYHCRFANLLHNNDIYNFMPNL